MTSFINLGARAIKRIILVLIVAFWGGDLIYNARPFWNSIDVVPYRDGYLSNHWALPDWQRDEGPVRYLMPGNELNNQTLTLSDFSRRRLISTPLGYHPVFYRTSGRIMDRLEFYHPNALRLFAINYLIWPEASPQPPPEGFSPIERHGDSVLIHNPQNRYVWPVGEVERVVDFETLLDRLADPDHNAHQTTLVVQDPATDPIVSDAAPMNLKTDIAPLAPGHMRLRCRTDAAGWIAISQPATPGWRVRIDGERRRDLPLRCNGHFMAIELPAGESEVVMIYDPPSQRLGLYFTLLSLGVLAGVAARRIASHTPANKKNPIMEQSMDGVSEVGR